MEWARNDRMLREIFTETIQNYKARGYIKDNVISLILFFVLIGFPNWTSQLALSVFNEIDDGKW